MSELSELFEGANLMTPEILGYYGTKEFAIELSTGTGIFGDRIFGVTVKVNGESDYELNRCLHSKTEAINYINKLLDEAEVEL